MRNGTIYRAIGFVLTQINRSQNLVRLPNGDVIHKMTLEDNPTSSRTGWVEKDYYDLTGGKYNLKNTSNTQVEELLLATN